MQQRRKRPSGARKPVVQAQAFEVVDPDGHVVARLGQVDGADVGESGVGLDLFDESGTRRLTLSLDSSGPALHLMAGGTVRLSVAVADSTALIAVRGEDGTEAFTIAISRAETA